MKLTGYINDFYAEDRHIKISIIVPTLFKLNPDSECWEILKELREFVLQNKVSIEIKKEENENKK